MKSTDGRFFDETWFYAPVEGTGETATLPEEEAHHALRVLRLKSGDEVVVSNGAGSVFRARLTGDGARIEVGERLHHDPAPPGLCMALGLLKGRDVEISVE